MPISIPMKRALLVFSGMIFRHTPRFVFLSVGNSSMRSSLLLSGEAVFHVVGTGLGLWLR